MKQQPLLFVALGVLLSLGTGCSNSARIARGKPLKNLNVGQVLERYDEQAAEWDWVGMRLDVTVDADGQRESFKASVRMARDSAIWMSISPALGVEVARIMLEPDTVLFVSKIPGNKFYYAGNYDALGEWADTPLAFEDLQSIWGDSPWARPGQRQIQFQGGRRQLRPDRQVQKQGPPVDRDRRQQFGTRRFVEHPTAHAAVRAAPQSHRR